MEKRKDKESVDLGQLRKRIDDLDRQIVALLSERAGVVVDVGKAKMVDGTPVYAPDREQEVLQRIASLNTGPLLQKTLRSIYRELMSGSFALEKPLRVGYLGPEGSFSHLAATRKFGASVEYYPLADIKAVFGEVSKDHCDVGIVPIENSIGGGILESMDAFIEANVSICAEVLLDIHHNLLAKCAREEINAIASKPEVFAQCRNWLSSTFSEAQLVPVASTARGAERAADEQGMAAIGSALAAELYGLRIVSANIEDTINNVTRFFVISSASAKRTGEDKTSLMFTTAHKAGALAAVINVFADHGINLTNIDTRPSKRRNWEYYFFVDAEGHYEDDKLAQAIEEAKRHCGDLYVLGSFPKATETV